MMLYKTLKVLVLSLIVSLKTNKALCDCGGTIKPKMRNGEPAYTSVMVYTRLGSEEGKHFEHR